MSKDRTVEIARMESKLAMLKKESREAARRDDTRRKIVVGAAVLTALDRGAIQRESVVRLLDAFVSGRDRDLFKNGSLVLPAKENPESPNPPPAMPAE